MLDCYVQEMMFMIIVICVTRMFDALVHKMSCTRTIMYVYVREPARVYIESTFDKAQSTYEHVQQHGREYMSHHVYK
jgi:hypothetical protein